MPYGDGTGPAGFGPMTGGGRGFCAGFFGRGRGIGLGKGRGFRNRFFATGLPFWARKDNQTGFISKDDEINILKNQAKYMQDEITAVNERIKELGKKTEQKKEK